MKKPIVHCRFLRNVKVRYDDVSSDSWPLAVVTDRVKGFAVTTERHLRVDYIVYSTDGKAVTVQYLH